MPQTQRNRELGLLLFAFLINGRRRARAAGRDRHIDWTFLYYCGGLTVLVLGCTSCCATAPQADPFVVPIATVLSGLGLAMIYRIDIEDRARVGRPLDPPARVARIAIAAAVAIVDLRRTTACCATRTSSASPASCCCAPVRAGPRHRCQRRCLDLDRRPLLVPAGRARQDLFAIFFAGYLVRTREALTSVGTRFLGMTWPRAARARPAPALGSRDGDHRLQRDLGTGLLIFGMFIAMLYVATGKTSWACSVCCSPSAVALASQVLRYVQALHELADAFDPAVIDGGRQLSARERHLRPVRGRPARHRSRPRPAGADPLSQSDYIFPSIGEELGLIGVFAILCLYMVFTSRGIRIGIAGQDDFGKLLATGLSFTIALQVFIMVGGVTRLIPLTGLTTPFLAAGGSSLVANWIVVALLLRISDAVRSRPGW
jgi:hypothetical protein